MHLSFSSVTLASLVFASASAKSHDAAKKNSSSRQQVREKFADERETRGYGFFRLTPPPSIPDHVSADMHSTFAL
jgi:hypothetical protein